MIENHLKVYLLRDYQTHENSFTEQTATRQEYSNAQSSATASDAYSSILDIPLITVSNPDQVGTSTHQPDYYDTASSTETEMSSSHRHSSSSSKGKHSSSSHTSSSDRGKSKSGSSSSKTKTDDWSDITDPEERRRVQNRIAQRKFRDKAKENRERQERDAENRAHAHHSYQPPDPVEMGTDEELNGLPWGSLSLRHVFSKGRAKESESRRGSNAHGGRSEVNYYHGHSPVDGTPNGLYEDADGYYEETSYYEDGERIYYDYGSGSGGSGHGGS